MHEEKCVVENFAPDQDAIKITVGDYVIVVSKLESGEVDVTVQDTAEGSEQSMILGVDGYSHRL